MHSMCAYLRYFEILGWLDVDGGTCVKILPVESRRYLDDLSSFEDMYEIDSL